MCISFNIFFNTEYFSLGLGYSPVHGELSDVSLVRRKGKGTALKKEKFKFYTLKVKIQFKPVSPVLLNPFNHTVGREVLTASLSFIW